jgi:hypothetical protein
MDNSENLLLDFRDLQLKGEKLLKNRRKFVNAFLILLMTLSMKQIRKSFYLNFIYFFIICCNAEILITLNLIVNDYTHNLKNN